MRVAKHALLFIAVAAMASLFAVSDVYSKPKKGSIVTVRVMRAKVMVKPMFIGRSVGRASRGQQLTYRGSKGDWYKISGRFNGWIHRTAVVDKKVQLSAKPGGGGGASRDEVELAGRGFTPEVESKYRNQNPNMDFSHVDSLEKLEVNDGELQLFVTSGGLGGGK